MMLDWLYLLGGFLLSLYIGRLCIPRIVLVSKKKRMFDAPDRRKVHAKPIPRLGGISFVPAIMVAFTFFCGLMWLQTDGVWLTGTLLAEAFFLGTGLIIVYIVGIWDDIAGLSWRFKFCFQVLAAGLMVCASPCLNDFQGLFGIHELPDWVAYPFTVLAVVAVINAFNLIDGLDGLCSGLSLLLFLSLGILFVRMDNYLWALLSACILGISLAFFLYNVFGEKLKIFMGDGGSLTLGYLAAFLCLKLFVSAQHSVHAVDSITPVVLLGMLFIPLFDMLRLFIARMCHGHSPFMPDKNHIHHKFLRLGYTHLQSTGMLMLIQGGYTLGNILMARWLDVNVVFGVDFLVAFGVYACLERRISRQVHD